MIQLTYVEMPHSLFATGLVLDSVMQEVSCGNVRNCPACANQESVVEGERSGFQIRRCRRCRTLFTAQLPDASQAMPYDEYYSEANLTIPAFIQQRLKEIVDGFSVYRKTNRLLEIGFGEGSLLAAAKRAGWDAEGVEVSHGAIDHARAAGLKVFCGSLTEANFSTECFDVVLASELIEHLPDPRALIIEVARILRPGGLFWATTPNGSGVSAKTVGMDWTVISPPEHLQLFSASGVRQLLAEGGFRDIRIASHGVNVFEIIHHYRARRMNDRAPASGDAPAGFDRVRSGYKLNESLTTNPIGLVVKYVANSALRFTRLGDSLKITAIK